MDVKAEAAKRIEKWRRSLVALSHRIHANPELGFEEERAASWLGEALDEAGFAVEEGICDLPTAFVGRSGSGPLHIAICAEYDALPGMGHACGHNMIAAMAVGAGSALCRLADDLGLTVSVIGTPAEEFGNGKTLMLERGAFEGVHLAMLVHPAPVDVLEPPLLAFSQFAVRYQGREADACMAPELGIDAADAMTIAQTAIGLLRQHLQPTDRVHGIVTQAGASPSEVPAYAEASYMVRARNRDQLRDVTTRVLRCFEAGARATGATHEILLAHEPYAEMLHDRDVAVLYGRNAESLGRWFPDLGDLLERGTGSTDLGNISHVIPAIHPAIGVDSLPASNHQPEFAPYCVTASADRALIDGALAMAWTAIDVSEDEEICGRLLAPSQLHGQFIRRSSM